MDILLASPVKAGDMMTIPCRVILAVRDNGYSNEYVTCIQDMDTSKFFCSNAFGDDMTEAIENYKARCKALCLSYKVFTLSRLFVAS
jgi:hypothetical protein